MMLTVDEFKQKFSDDPFLQLFISFSDKVLDLFKKAGWEGDGELLVSWIPPFATSIHVPDGIFVYYVKQKNNGTSFIFSLTELENIRNSEVKVS
ncbi:MAG: hypothetical protein LUH15_11195 [Tannerellaceae bacterium]|nr:hypothetical protein [Tannerellaceae bacterium]